MKTPGLLVRALLGQLFLLAVIAALLGFAGTPDYWQAWVFLAVFTACSVAITVDLARRDPALLERRVKAGPVAERRRAQRLIQSFAAPGFLAISRRSWPATPTTASA